MTFTKEWFNMFLLLILCIICVCVVLGMYYSSSNLNQDSIADEFELSENNIVRGTNLDLRAIDGYSSFEDTNRNELL
jgi:hypothetical protein